MARKILWISITIGAVIIAYLFWFTVGLGFHQEAAQLALNGSPYSDNMTGLTDAVNSSPFWMSFLPALVGIIFIIIILRQPEKQ